MRTISRVRHLALLDDVGRILHSIEYMESLKIIQSQLDFILPNHRHWLFPRTGQLVAKCLRVLGANSFRLWRYGEGASNRITTSFYVPVDASTSQFLCREWRQEAFGFAFPELAFVSENVEGDLFDVLANCCHPLWHGLAPSKKFSKALSRLLLRTEWAVFPLAVSPFLEEAVTDYCLVLTNDAETHELIGLELSGDTKLFQWDISSLNWPIPNEAEIAADFLWQKELSETS